MDSVYYSILDAVATRVAGVAEIPRVDLRYELQLYEGESVPLVIVAPGPEFEKRGKGTFSKGIWWVYPVLVALVWPGNRVVKTELQQFMGLRQAIRNELTKLTLPDVTTVFDSNADPEAVSKFAASVASNYRVTGWLVNYTSAEQYA